MKLRNKTLLSLALLPAFAGSALALEEPAPRLLGTCSTAGSETFMYLKYELLTGAGSKAFVRISGNTGHAGTHTEPATLTLKSWVTYEVKFQEYGVDHQIVMSNHLSPALATLKTSSGESTSLACTLESGS